MPEASPKQAVATMVFGAHAEMLDQTFTSFAINPALPMHAFILGDALPKNRVEGITYHLVKPQNTFSQIYRETNYRRWEVLDELDVDYVLLVDGVDVLCLQPLPAIPEILCGLDVAASVEHAAGRFMFGSQYTSTYFNAGVSWWNIQASRDMREEILKRGRTRFRSKSDDQHTFNEILNHHHDRVRVLGHHYNCRGVLNRKVRGWPTLKNLDGVKIYHTDDWQIAKTMMPVKPATGLPHLEPDNEPLTPKQQFWRNVGNQFQPHKIK